MVLWEAKAVGLTLFLPSGWKNITLVIWMRRHGRSLIEGAESGAL